jgi:hypothetical protein
MIGGDAVAVAAWIVAILTERGLVKTGAAS